MNFLDNLDKKIKQHEGTLLSGYPQSMAEYKELLGQIFGMKHARELYLEALKENADA